MIYIGCVGFPQKISQYKKKLRFAELDSTFGQLPRPKTLTRLRQEAGEDFLFSMRALHQITHPASAPIYRAHKPSLPPEKLPLLGLFQWTEPVREAYEKTRKAAEALGARALVFETPLEFTPSRENQERFLRFFREIDRQDLLMVWEPRGPWERERVEEIAEEANVIVAQDPLAPTGFEEEEPQLLGGEIGYFRLRGPAGGRQRYSTLELEEILGFAEAYEKTLIAFASPLAFADAVALTALVESAKREEVELSKEEE